MAADQHSVNDGVERLRLDRSAGEAGDRLGRSVGLLGCDAAVLDGEIGRVPGGRDPVELRHLAVRIDRDEPVVSLSGTPGVDGPNSSGNATTRSTCKRRDPGLIETSPGPGVSQCAEGMNRMPFSSSSCPTAWLASEPKTANGAPSGVASVIDTSTFMSNARRAVISASS